MAAIEVIRRRINIYLQLGENDVRRMKEALLCYEMYQEMAEKTGVSGTIGDKVHFEIVFQEHNPL